jgi:signal transduction histidine kinase
LDLVLFAPPKMLPGVTEVTSEARPSRLELGARTIVSERSKLWMLAAGCLVFAQACASVLIAPGFALTVFSDVTQCILLLSGLAALVPNIAQSQGRTRLFWGLMTLGVAFWLTYQLMWSYIEVVLRQEVPDPFVGDIVIFLHFVPMMAALALQPQSQQDDHEAKLGRLDFILLLTWWVYLYVFGVIPWQYAQSNELAYGRSLNALYLTEKLVFLVGLVFVWFRSGKGWKIIYAHWFGASLVYALSSYVANWAIQRNVYYTGSLYDLPVAASMGWISVIGVISQDLRPAQIVTDRPLRRTGVWVARVGMLVILSLPCLAAWSVFDHDVSPRVRNLRLISTLVTMLVMGGIVFVRQHLLDGELLRLLHASQDSFEDLKHLQARLVQSEKLASLGQLVGGAAQELNNPLTAMLGYSECLAESGATAEQRTLAAKITQQVKRTRGLISSLLSFAKQIPGEKMLVDVNTVAQTAVKLCQPQFSTHKIEVQMNLAEVAQVLADPNQLLQVCLHIGSNALNALEEVGGGIFTLKSYPQGTKVILEFSDTGPGVREPERVFDPFYTTRPVGKGAGLGLSACYGIIQEHQGQIQCSNRVEGGTTIRIELPQAKPNPSPTHEGKVAPAIEVAQKA